MTMIPLENIKRKHKDLIIYENAYSAIREKAGSLVECKAEVKCRIQSDDKHMNFSTLAEANEYSELKIAQEYGGMFGAGLSDAQKERLAELEEIGKISIEDSANTESTTPNIHSKILALEKEIEYLYQ